MLNLHCNHDAQAGFDDSITLLAPQWGSAVHFGGPKIRARIALSFGAVPPNARVNSACNLHADAEFVDSITLLAPPWGSAVHFGGAKIRARIALSFGAVRPYARSNSACNLHAHVEVVDSIQLPSAAPPPCRLCRLIRVASCRPCRHSCLPFAYSSAHALSHSLIN